ncbi:anti-sigma factor family protein [Amycolatopsis palatopharyngis]|uniref:anti-sigma factor family protein n=1 Tax=Amycolatopsis palatopharyngis TaxID=187982 RepID=UPI000E237839|nr:Asp23/Gls24 family envelope stress response protein [Amycolatopsis palatopharyngis]
MAMNSTNSAGNGYELPCERELEQVWEYLDNPDVDDGVDEHERTCPHCRTARESLRALREATAELIEETEQPPPDLFGKIMSAVRAEVRRGHMVRLPSSEPGVVEVSEQAVAVVLRFAADSVPGVRARRCRIATVGVGQVGESQVEVQLTLAVDYRNQTTIEALTEVRARVSAAAAARVGLQLVALDLVVDDIYGADGGERG